MYYKLNTKTQSYSFGGLSGGTFSRLDEKTPISQAVEAEQVRKKWDPKHSFLLRTAQPAASTP